MKNPTIPQRRRRAAHVSITLALLLCSVCCAGRAREPSDDDSADSAASSSEATVTEVRTSLAGKSGAEQKQTVALKNAREAGTSAALRQLMTDYPGTRAADDARAELPAALLREARAKNDSAAYRAIVTEFPGSAEASEARLKIRTLYDDALGQFLARAPQGNRQLAQYVSRLAEYLKAGDDQTVEIRYRERKSNPDAPPYVNYDPSSSAKEGVMASLERAFAPFGEGLLTLKEGDTVSGPGELRAAARPTVYVEYMDQMNDELFNSPGHKDPVVGYNASLKVSMKIPGEATSFDFSVSGRTPHHFSASEGDVYFKVTDLAVEQLLLKLDKVFVANAGAVAPPRADVPARAEPPASVAPPAGAAPTARPQTPTRRSM